MVQHVVPAFLGFWALISLTLVSCFQQDVHPTFLDAMTHVKIGTYSL
jgi:hypothetical protein